MIDDHGVGARDVEARLDNGRAAQDVVAPVDEVDHDPFQFGFGHLAMGHADACPRRQGANLARPLGQILHPVVHEEHLASARQFLGNCFAQKIGIMAAHEGADGQPVSGWGGDDGDLAYATHRHLQGARDGRGGQGEHVHLRAHLLEPLLVRNPEPLFLVDDEQPQVAEVHIARQQAVGADDDVQLSAGQRGDGVPLLALAAKT